MDAVIAYLPAILRGTSITIAVALCSVALAVLLGLLGAWGKLAASRVANAVTGAYTTLIRGVPDLVLMLLLLETAGACAAHVRILDEEGSAIRLGRVEHPGASGDRLP